MSLLNCSPRYMSKTRSELPTFKLPVPKASARHLITSHVIEGINKDTVLLGDIDDVLIRSLDSCGYYERSYYSVPGGFALVTRMESIFDDARSKKMPERWAVNDPPNLGFSPLQLLKRLFTANPGFFRTIVFIVTDTVCLESDMKMTNKEADSWLTCGGKSLPISIAEISYSDTLDIIAFIYEFKKERSDTLAIQTDPSKHQGRTHLERAKLWTCLGGIR